MLPVTPVSPPPTPIPNFVSWFTRKLVFIPVLAPLKGFGLQTVWQKNTLAKLIVLLNLQHLGSHFGSPLL